MGRYISLTDVKDSVPQVRIDTTSRPPESQVARIIDEVEADTEVQLTQLGYVTPITGTSSLRILRSMLVQEVVSRIIIAQVAGVRNPDDLGAGRAHKQYQDTLDALIDNQNPFELPDAQKADIREKLEPVSSFVGNVDPISGNPLITRNKVF